MDAKQIISKTKHLKPENFYDLKFLGNINVVKGDVFFEMEEPIKETNDYRTGIYRLSNGKVTRFTRGEKDSNFIMNPTGELMAYQSVEGSKSRICIRDLKSSSDRPIKEIDGTVIKMDWSTDSKGIYLIIENRVKEGDFRVFEHIPLYSDNKGFIEGLTYEFVYLDSDGKSTVILKSKEELKDFAINPNKKEIALIVRQLDSDDYHSKIGIMSLKNRSITYLKDKDDQYCWPLGIGGPVSMAYLEDGTLAFFLNKHETSIDEAPELVLWKDGHLNEVMKDHDISPGSLLSTDSWMISSRMMMVKSGHVYFVATVHGRAGIYRVDASGKMDSIVVGDFCVDSFDLYDDQIYFIGQTSDLPQEIYRYDVKAKLITSINGKAERWELRKPLNFHFTASDGVAIEAWILKGKGAGTIVRVHGGPRGAFGEAFIYESHLLNSMGFNVIYCNPRGSGSYGDEFSAAVLKKYGERDYEDIIELVNYSSLKFNLNLNKLGVTGGSYGGFMVNWIVGHTDLFKAAVADRSFSDLISDYFAGDIGPAFNSDQIGGTPYDNLDRYWEKSPIKHIVNCKTPLLLIQNDADYRCPVWEAYELFTQLKKQGSVTKLIVFKGENHSLPLLGKPKNRVKRLEEITSWFGKFLK